ncbi:MAG TPA: protein translocase subunit SecD [Candidatus Paceibacterota bacterium]
MKIRIIALILIILGALIGYFDYASQKVGVGFVNKFPFKLGLDLSGGTHLVYKADTSTIPASDINASMEALRDVVEKRVNLFGVSEPIVQVEQGGVLGNNEADQKLIVELPGVTDVAQAVALIGKTPSLEFKLLTKDNEAKLQALGMAATASTTAELFTTTGLTGRLVQRATLEFLPQTSEPVVSLMFNQNGKDLFAKITREHVGEVLAIFLDEKPISLPVIREEIRDGKAQISGGFTPEGARNLVRDLNFGALPVPIELASTQTIGATLGDEATHAGVRAGMYAFGIIALFLILWYRLPGVIAIIALCVYVALNLAIFKLIPVTLTSAGIAGFILSLGMAVDANILIFERMKEELKRGKALPEAVNEGFARAWLSIRDSNLSSIITGVILYVFASTAIIKGFALVFIIGVLISMFSAITFSRTLLKAIGVRGQGKISKFLFSSGIN